MTRPRLLDNHIGGQNILCRIFKSVLPALEPVFEPSPFPIRIQTAADLEAARFDLLAWADPHRVDGPASPFWVQSGMVEAVLEPDAEPLVPLVTVGGGAIEGLRLAEGGLVLKIECAGAVVQIGVRGLRAVPRRRRDRGSSPLRAADATDGRANARLLERCGPAGPSGGAGWGARTGLL